MGKISFSLILALALVTIGASSGSKCVLSGTWRSNWGCLMNVSVLSNGGEFSGSYQSAAMATGDNALPSPLHGVQQNVEQKQQPTFGFTVKWQLSESPPTGITVFVGQCFVDDQGKEALQTKWLLRKEVRSLRDNWKATRVGTNIFTRVK
ncbi:avidin-like [Emydura macquarii macquarii]|uniref:avidin-like n=1 Tax=Emydura macquarii macquarii TaxID=1129001 RepID=UPI00352B8B0E